jgi:hypothetical protein
MYPTLANNNNDDIMDITTPESSPCVVNYIYFNYIEETDDEADDEQEEEYPKFRRPNILRKSNLSRIRRRLFE